MLWFYARSLVCDLILKEFFRPYTSSHRGLLANDQVNRACFAIAQLHTHGQRSLSSITVSPRFSLGLLRFYLKKNSSRMMHMQKESKGQCTQSSDLTRLRQVTHSHLSQREPRVSTAALPVGYYAVQGPVGAARGREVQNLVLGTDMSVSRKRHDSQGMI